MSDRTVIEADLGFVNGMLNSGAEDLKKCYQCSTCTVVCPITPDGGPFPRKEMINAQWGLKDKLVTNMDSWLCYQCNDCSTHCPRDAKPGDVLATIRNMAVKHFTPLSFISKAATNPAGILMLLLIPILIIGALIFGLHGTQMGFMDGQRIVFSKMIPVPFVDSIFISVATLTGLMAFLGLSKFIKALSQANPKTGQGESLGAAIMGTVTEILTHKKFKDCGTNQSRYTGHLLTMYGFIGLFITTNLVMVFHYMHEFGLTHGDTPYAFGHPIKIIGNVSALLAVSGIFLILMRRMTSSDVGTTSTFDWAFIWVVFLTIVSGILSQVFRVAAMETVAYATYYVHLVFVFYLLAYAPHTKFAHIFYRTAALIYARYSGRNVGQIQSSQQEDAA